MKMISVTLLEVFCKNFVNISYENASFLILKNCYGKFEINFDCFTNDDMLIYHAHICQNEFEKLNWLPISDRINQCVLLTTFKFFKHIGPNYFNEVFQWATESNRTLRNDYRKLKHPFHKNLAGQNLLSFLSLSKWNKLPESTKKLNNINTFKHS